MSRITDITDISRLVEWDETSFHWLYREYYKSLVTYAMHLVDDMPCAEDIVEELFVHIYDTRLPFASFQALRNYLYSSVYHRCIDNMRHNKTVNLFAQETARHGEAMIDDDETASFREEFYRRLFKVIDAMPPRQRAVFVAAMDGKSNKEIAEELGISVDTVKTQKKRGMKTLREDMNDGRMASALKYLLLFYLMS